MNPAEILQRFENLPFTTEIEMDEVVLTLRQIFDLQEGTVIATQHPAGAPFRLKVGGVEVASAEIVVIDDSVSARVEKLCEKPKNTGEANGNS